MSTVQAIAWYTGEVAKIYEPKARINGTYSEEYKDALFQWKKVLNKRCELELRKRREDTQCG
jgi:hypothetical protein